MGADPQGEKDTGLRNSQGKQQIEGRRMWIAISKECVTVHAPGVRFELEIETGAWG